MFLTTPYDAVLFDLDGVLTSTAALHAACWKVVFDEVLAGYGRPSFDVDREYVAHVDGKTREDGVRDFLASRGLEVGEGTIRHIAERKQALVEQVLDEGGVEAFPGSVRWVELLRADGVRTAVVSSSQNSGKVLAAAGIAHLFDHVVDGGDIKRLGLRGKPSPDGFLEAARRLDVEPSRAVVVEDALAGVAAGRAGDFGMVIGVARNAEPAALRSAGADIVVGDLRELVP